MTPNTFEEAERQITESRGSDRVLGGVLQLAGVPVVRVAAVVRPNVQTRPAAAAGAGVLLGPRGGLRVLAAELSRRGAAGADRGRGDLPADPGLVIATVDKLAQLPWKAATATAVRAGGHRVHAARLAEPGFRRLLRARRASGRGRTCRAA